MYVQLPTLCTPSHPVLAAPGGVTAPSEHATNTRTTAHTATGRRRAGCDWTNVSPPIRGRLLAGLHAVSSLHLPRVLSCCAPVIRERRRKRGHAAVVEASFDLGPSPTAFRA